MRYEMSKQEARKITIIEELLAHRLSNAQAAQLLNLSLRQVQRLKAEAAAHGALAVLHKSRGKKPANSINPVLAQTLVKTYCTSLVGYNFCHATDILAEEHSLFLSVSTVARYLKAAGIRSPKAKRRPKKHRSRESRPCEGEMAQMDASKFDWLDNGTYLHLHGAVDDATGRVLALHLEKEETFEGYCALMFQMNHDGHLPREIYTDARTVFVYNSKKKRDLTIAEELVGIPEKQTQFARALRESGILLIIAGSAQAKGKIERLWETLQDRLAKDMHRHDITTVDQANAFLKTYIPYYNRKFAVQAAKLEKLYLPSKKLADFRLTFSRQVPRQLNNGLVFSFNGQTYRFPLSVNGMKIPASPHDTLTVATSRHIGIQVIFKGLSFSPELLVKQPKSSINPVASAANDCEPSSRRVPRQPAANHPWRKTVCPAYPVKGDVFADYLYRRKDVISPDY